MLHKQQKHIEQKNENFNVSTVIESIKISKKHLETELHVLNLK